MRLLGKRDSSLTQTAAPLALTVCLCGRAHGQVREMTGSLAGQLRLFQLRVVSGRICAFGPNSHQNLASNFLGNQRHERLSIDLADGLPTVTYEQTAPDGKISVEIVRGDRVVVQQTPRSAGDHASVIFVQPREGALRLTVAVGEQSKSYVSPSIWHLLLEEPDACRQYLVPLLQIMRPNWQLVEQSAELERLLCRGDVGRLPVNLAVWQDCVAALASPRYVDRERAQQRLLAEGPTVLPFLRSQERTGLDAEQSFRLRRIIRSLAGGGGEDSPERVAPALVVDPRVWFALLDRDEAAVRRKAAHKLASVLGTAIEFDADAPPAVRDNQRESLGERFGDMLAPPPFADEGDSR